MMFDLHVPASMSALPGRAHVQPMGQDIQPLPKGNAHPVKRTSSDRLEQMRTYYHDNREKLAQARRDKYNREKPPVDKIATHAAKIARIVHDSGPRLVIVVRGRPVLYKAGSATAERHYAHCKSIVGTYKPGVRWEQIAEDLREVMA